MISLTEILKDIMDTFFSLRATASLEAEGESAMMVTLEKAKPIQLRLKEWYSKLPQNLAVGQTKARKLSSTGKVLILAYVLILILNRIPSSRILCCGSHTPPCHNTF
jgi:hypothetical protein